MRQDLNIQISLKTLGELLSTFSGVHVKAIDEVCCGLLSKENTLV